MRRRTVTSLAVCVTSIAASLVTDTAFGVGNDVDGGCMHHRRSFSYTWSTPPPAAVRTAVGAGFAEWNVPLDYNGQRLFQWAENSSDPYAVDVTVFYGPEPDGAMGVAYCSSNHIHINSDPRYQAYDVLRSTAGHEAGHIGALEHVGRYDSFGAADNPPLMATCLDATTSAEQDLSQEDASAITFAHTRLSRSSLTANVGFEQGASYWGMGGGGHAYVTHGGATGPGFIRYDAFAPSNSLSQTTRYTDAPTQHVVGVVNHSKTAISDVGTIRVELWARPIAFGPHQGCTGGGQFPNGKNMNYPVVTEALEIRATTGNFEPSGTGWTKASTPAWTTFSEGEQDVQLRVYEDMRTYNGGVSSVRLDNARIECSTQQSEGDCT